MCAVKTGIHKTENCKVTDKKSNHNQPNSIRPETKKLQANRLMNPIGTNFSRSLDRAAALTRDIKLGLSVPPITGAPPLSLPRANGGAHQYQRRNVRFAPSCSVVLVPTHLEMTDEEFHGVWYGEEEAANLMADNVRVIREMRRQRHNKAERSGRETECDLQGEDERSRELCIRGLEAMVCAQALSRRKSEKRAVIDAVLDVQDRQRESGVFNKMEQEQVQEVDGCEQDIRKASKSVSSLSVKRALKAAAEDAEFVRREIALLGAARNKYRHAHATLSSRRPAASLRRPQQQEEDFIWDILKMANRIPSEGEPIEGQVGNGHRRLQR